MSRLRRLSPEHRFRLAAVLAVLAGVMVCGTLLLAAITAFDLRAQVETVRRLSQQVTQQNAQARFDDCVAGDRIRVALYTQALASSKTTPILLRLVPSLDTPQVRQLVAVSRARQLKAFRPRGTDGCEQYALQSVPPAERTKYRITP